MTKQSLLSTIALAALLLASPSLAQEPPAQKSAQQSENSRSFTFTDSEGKKIEIVVTKQGIKVPSLKGKNVILLFYIYSGTPCRNELQIFSKLKPKLNDLEFVTFELKGLKPDELKAFEKELGLEGLHMIDSTQALPFARFIGELIRWPGSVPLIIALTKNGEVKHMQMGAMSSEEIEKLDASM